MMRYIHIQLILAVLLALAGLPGTAARAAPNWSAYLRRYPYLTDLVGPYATINWATDQSSTIGQVRWGQVGAEGCTALLAVMPRFIARDAVVGFDIWKRGENY